MLRPLGILCGRLSRSLWASYGPLIEAVIEALAEFVVLVFILLGSRKFLKWAAPGLSCDSVIDCVHTIGFVIVWLMLVVGFIGYAVLFGYQRFMSRARVLLATKRGVLPESQATTNPQTHGSAEEH